MIYSANSFVIRLALKVFPLRTPPEFEGLDIAALKKKYFKRALADIFLFILIAPLLVHLLQARFLAHSQAFNPRTEAIYTLNPDSGFWYVPASLIGVVLASVFIHFLNRCSLPDGGREYRYWSDARTGFGASKLYLTMGVLVAAAGSALAYCAEQSHLVLAPTGLIVHRLGSSELEQHSYSDILALREVTGTDGQDSEFRIEFRDAAPWTTSEEEIFPEAEQKSFLEQAAGKPIETVSK